MKKIVVAAGILSTIFLSGCEKDEALVPAEKTLLKADKGILCRGCGDWDIITPEPEGTSLRVAAPSADATNTPAVPAKPAKGKK